MRNKKGWYQNGFSMGEFLTFFSLFAGFGLHGRGEGMDTIGLFFINDKKKLSSSGKIIQAFVFQVDKKESTVT